MTEPLTVDDAKGRLRRLAGERRAGLTAAAREESARRLADTGLAFLSPRPGDVVSGYLPIGDELDPVPLLARLAAAGHGLVLPVTPRGRGRLTFRRWVPGDALVEGLFGVSEPRADAAQCEPRVLLVPLLAFDAGGHRLGYGAGYYDRTLADLRASDSVTAVGLAFAEQEMDAIPTDRYDQRLDWILTPEGPRRIEA